MSTTPWTLMQCIDKIEASIDLDDRRKLEAVTKDNLISLHFGFGMWIRNNCNLWTSGCEEVVADIQRIMNAGIAIHSLDEPCRFSFNPDHQHDPASIYHPDNCSFVIIDLYHDLINGNIGLSIIDR